VQGFQTVDIVEGTPSWQFAQVMPTVRRQLTLAEKKEQAQMTPLAKRPLQQVAPRAAQRPLRPSFMRSRFRNNQKTVLSTRLRPAVSSQKHLQ